MRYCAVIPAAGSGTRMGSCIPKVLLKPSLSQSEHAATILQTTVSLFADDERCERVVVCVPRGQTELFAEHLAAARGVAVVEGGSTRQLSVLAGLEELEREGRLALGTVVLVHDAARCCVSAQVISRVLEGVARNGAVTAALPAVDSLCRVEDGVIVNYIDRASAWSVQTPQGFIGLELLEAHRAAQQEGLQALDDAALVARLRPVSVVVGDARNIKVTHPEDLAVAAATLGAR